MQTEFSTLNKNLSDSNILKSVKVLQMLDIAFIKIFKLNKSWTGMRILVMLLLDTLPMLGNVLLLCFFVFFIFGIIGT